MPDQSLTTAASQTATTEPGLSEKPRPCHEGQGRQVLAFLLLPIGYVTHTHHPPEAAPDPMCYKRSFFLSVLFILKIHCCKVSEQ